MRFSRISIALATLFCWSALAQDLPLTISTGGQIQRLQSGRAIQGQAPTTANPTLILPEGTAPTSPANGACWLTTAGMFCHTSVGGTMGPFGALPSVATLNILANLTGGSAAPIGHTLSDAIDAAIGSAQGDILYRGASSWSVLAPGTSGFFLKTQGASANPVWASASGGSGNVVATGSATTAQCFLSDGTSSPYGATVATCPGGGGGSGLFSGSLGTVPTLASTGFTTWVNQRGSTVADGVNGILFSSPSAGAADNASLYCKLAPSTPYTVTYAISFPITTGGSFPVAGIALENSSTGVFFGAGGQNRGSGGTLPPVTNYTLQTYTNPASATAVNFSGYTNTPQLMWFKMLNDGTNIVTSVSFDGIQWSVAPYNTYAMASGAFSGGLPDSICLYNDPVNGVVSEVLMSYSD